MLNIKSRADLDRLIVDAVKESLTLDYKQSLALTKDDKKKEDLCKDVTAFANSAGGQLVYGMEEDKHAPTKIDDGADPAITKEWVEQVIDSKVQPRIEGFVIHPIQLAKGLGFVIDIPQATSRAPHQAPDKRYYKRQNFQTVAMEDYEVRDALRRATTPDLFVILSFLAGPRHVMEFTPGTEQSRPFNLIARIENRSPQPAYHAIVDIGMDVDLIIKSRGAYTQLAGTTIEARGRPFNWLRWSLASLPGLPIFREHVTTLTDNVLMLALHSQYLQGSNLLDLSVKVSAPGFSSTEHWAIVTNGPTLQIHPPGSQWARPKDAQ